MLRERPAPKALRGGVVAAIGFSVAVAFGGVLAVNRRDLAEMAGQILVAQHAAEEARAAADRSEAAARRADAARIVAVEARVAAEAARALAESRAGVAPVVVTSVAPVPATEAEPRQSWVGWGLTPFTWAGGKVAGGYRWVRGN